MVIFLRGPSVGLGLTNTTMKLVIFLNKNDHLTSLLPNTPKEEIIKIIIFRIFLGGDLLRESALCDDVSATHWIRFVQLTKRM